MKKRVICPREIFRIFMSDIGKILIEVSWCPFVKALDLVAKQNTLRPEDGLFQSSFVAEVQIQNQRILTNNLLTKKVSMHELNLGRKELLIGAKNQRILAKKKVPVMISESHDVIWVQHACGCRGTR